MRQCSMPGSPDDQHRAAHSLRSRIEGLLRPQVRARQAAQSGGSRAWTALGARHLANAYRRPRLSSEGRITLENTRGMFRFTYDCLNRRPKNRKDVRESFRYAEL